MSGTSKYRVRPLSSLHAGQLIPVDGDSTIEVDAELAQSFGEGDQVIPVAATGCSPAQLLHIPKVSLECVKAAVDRAEVAGTIMKETSNDTIAHFYTFAIQYLQDDEIWSAIAEVNKKDVAKACACGRSITRLQVSDEMRRLMIEGLDTWRTITPSRGQILQRVVHPARPDVGQSEWVCELVASELGIVSFVFEGRPNVVIDATGVLRSGNTVVFRIGRDALETARCIVQRVIHPALERAGLPTGAVSLVDDVAHASAWALFRDKRLALAVARGSGTSVALLGGLARAAGIPVSLHGTGGAWMIISSQHPLDAEATALAVAGSLDRKVCNTLNTICICDGVSSETMDAVACGLAKAAEKRGVDATKVHIVAKTLNEQNVLRAVFSRSHIHITDTTDKQEPLCTEWEWEDTPEVTLCLVQDTAEAIELFNKYSPRFVLSMMSADATECDTTFRMAECPFFCTGITRWVDGQYALRRPELGLTNWEFGRLFGRGGILTGDGIFSVKTRVVGNLLQK